MKVAKHLLDMVAFLIVSVATLANLIVLASPIFIVYAYLDGSLSFAPTVGGLLFIGVLLLARFTRIHEYLE